MNSLTKVRFDEVQYKRRDIEEAILVPGRDQDVEYQRGCKDDGVHRPIIIDERPS